MTCEGPLLAATHPAAKADSLKDAQDRLLDEANAAIIKTVLVDALEAAADFIKEQDEGDHSNSTGWKSEETLGHWIAVQGAIKTLRDAPGRSQTLSAAVSDIIAERRRQVEVEGWSAEHDDGHNNGEIALAAATYAYTSTLANSEVEAHKNALWGMPSGVFSVVQHLWRWDARWFKPRNQRRDLVRSGALTIAEIERIDRLRAAQQPAGEKEGG